MKEAERIIRKLKRQELAKAIMLTVSTLMLIGIMGADYAIGSNIDGVTNITLTGDVTVGGECYMDGSIGCVPAGSILFFTSTCPTGWTRQTAFDSDYIYIIGTTSVGGGGASHSHTHNHDHAESISSSSAGAAHTHTNQMTGGTTTFNHRHTQSFNYVTGDSGARGYWVAGGQTGYTSASHSHSFTGSASSAGAAHLHTWSGTSDSTSPTLGSDVWDLNYYTVIVCKKD